MKFNVGMMEKLIERDVTPSEAKTINWLSEWEQETQNNIFMLMMAYGSATFKSGKSEKCEEYEESAREMRDRALMIIGAFIRDDEETKKALAALDGDLDALKKSSK